MGPAAHRAIDGPPEPPPQPPPGVTAFRDISYTGDREARHLLDVYVPDNAKEPLPLIVWIYGGAWMCLDKTSAKGGPALPSSAHGYVVACIDYSHTQEAIFPAQVHDAKAAIRFLRAHAKEYHIDPNQIGAWGESSGAYLAAMLGTTGGVAELEGTEGNCLEQSSRVQAVVDFCGPSDFPLRIKTTPELAKGPNVAFLGGWGDEVMDRAIKASPVTYASKDAPPFLIVHGDKDKGVPFNQGESMFNALKDKGADVTFVPVKDGGHAVMTPQNIRTANEFLAKHLKNYNMQTYTYKTVGDLNIKADVYGFGDGKTRPVLVNIHGGALISGGRKRGLDPLADLLDLAREEGYVLVSFDYRLAPETKLSGIIEDVRDALRWVNQKGPELFGADTSRIVVSGNSAGGYLTLMTGLMEPRPKALVSYWGYGSVDSPWYTTPYEYYRKILPLIDANTAATLVYKGVLANPLDIPARDGGRYYPYLRQNGLWTKEVTGFDPNTEKDKLDPYCPVRNVTPQYPPTVFVHGEEDKDVPVQEAINMAEQLKLNGVRYELIIVPGADHVLSGAGDPKLKEQARARAREFIKENLGPAKD